MTIAVDFDGTIVEHLYPAIGKEKIFAFETLKALQKDGHHLILWTFRAGKELEEAVAFCKSRGLEFYAINKSYPEEVFDHSRSRKISADLFIDDRNIGGFPGWGEIWQMINTDASKEKNDKFISAYRRAERRTLCGFIKYLFCRDN
ncbi:hydrolase [Marinilabiliaceae bacterium JC017]|nr:hydrolase [Marinilabiliaceae bacterium JC017]